MSTPREQPWRDRPDDETPGRVVVLTRNPLNLDRRLVILAGCRTFGCLGAARLLTKDHARVLSRRIGRSDATQLFVVKVPVVGTTVGELEILDHRSV